MVGEGSERPSNIDVYYIPAKFSNIKVLIIIWGLNFYKLTLSIQHHLLLEHKMYNSIREGFKKKIKKKVIMITFIGGGVSEGQ